MARAGQRIVFLFNLIQDVNIHRGLAYLAARECEAEIHFLVSAGFAKRDSRQSWRPLLEGIAADLGATIQDYATGADAAALLAGAGGIVIAASESDLEAHWETHDVLVAAPASYVTITLQHGFECVGFRQSREHVIHHGRDIGFGADFVAGWFGPERLTSMIASQRAKLVAAGPPTLLQAPPLEPDLADRGGLVCENMHSVRLTASGDHRSGFMAIFEDFCAAQGASGRKVTLRPHPGGQYVLKNKVELAPNVELENRPMFEVDLTRFDYGISAPSTIVIDMVLAGIPVGVWVDPRGIMDASNYEGLTMISSLEDWLGFERDVRLRRDMILERQERFLEASGLIRDPATIYANYARLLCGLLDRREAA